MNRFSKKEQGFTLIELMMAVTITLMLTSIAIYNILGDLPKYRLRATANRIAATVQYLKLRAVSTNNIAWMDVNYGTAGEHYFTGYVDANANNTADAGEYDLARLDLPDEVGGVKCFKLPGNITFGFPNGYSPAASNGGPDGTTPGTGNLITTNTIDTGYSGGFLGYRPTGVPVINPGAPQTTPNPVAIFVTNNLGEGYAVSVQITGRVKVWRWSNGEWQ
jgi:prepilin-type N-terminal cleavage/methylation domain-containing protein